VTIRASLITEDFVDIKLINMTFGEVIMGYNYGCSIKKDEEYTNWSFIN
jgi:hypothetical protein